MKNNLNEIRIEVPGHGATTAVVYEGADVQVRPNQEGTAGATLILAHGAGAGQRSPFIVGFARALAALGLDVVTFNFLYTEQRRGFPDRAPLLETTYHVVIDTVREQVKTARRALFIGGKSMGGRIATQVAAADRNAAIAGLVLIGYPLHPPGRPDKRRDAHLPSVERPMLFVQGSRDTFGTPAELAPVLSTLHPPSTLHVVEGGDHSFKIARGDAARQAAVLDDIQRTIAQWIGTITGRPAPAPRRLA